MSEIQPVISVVMAAYNAEAYLAEAIQSILQQTYRDFEFIIIDDASIDGSAGIIQHFQKADRRIRAFRNESNSGLGISLQRGIRTARGKLIARMDADDISLIDRFEKQVEYLSGHPEIMVLGGDCLVINEQGNYIPARQVPKDPGLMRWNMLLGNGLILVHGSVMIRKDFFDKFGEYSDLRAAQDFELWTRVFNYEPLPIANLNRVIYNYRHHGKTTTKSQNSLQERNAVQVRLRKIEDFLGRPVSPNVVLAYRHPGDHYQDIRPCILDWIDIYEKFIAHFQIKNNTQTLIKAELLYELHKYTYLKPNHRSSRVRTSFVGLLSAIPFNIALELLLFKLKRARRILFEN